MTRLLKAWGAGCAGAWLLQLVLGVVIGGCVFGVIAIAALLPLPPESEGYRPLMMGGGLVFVAVGAVAIAGAWGAWSLLSRKRQLDAAFAPLGLRGQMYLLNGRHYQGVVQGRPVDAWFYRGPALDFYVGAAVHTRLSITASADALDAAVAGALQRQPLKLTDPALHQLRVFAADAGWTQALLAVPEVAVAVRRLVTSEPEGGAFEVRQLHVQPGAVYVRLYRTRVSQLAAAPAAAWLADLLTLAQAAESLPPPLEVLTASPLEQNARTRRQAFTGLAFAFSCALVAALGVCSAGLVALALLAERH
jgi:hypothetical protein